MFVCVCVYVNMKEVGWLEAGLSAGGGSFAKAGRWGEAFSKSAPKLTSWYSSFFTYTRLGVIQVKGFPTLKLYFTLKCTHKHSLRIIPG